MKFLQSPLWLLVLVLLFLAVLLWIIPVVPHPTTPDRIVSTAAPPWQPPDEKSIPPTEAGDLIRYGRELIAHTSVYLGPKGRVEALTNGMNCQNCHLDAGTRNYGNPFSAVKSTYPKYRPRSGHIESIEFRVNDCLQRSLNGRPLDSNSREMKAMVAYISWVGKDVPTDLQPAGSGIEPLPFLSRAADTAKGRMVYLQKCQSCHGANGQGLPVAGSGSFVYPPLWGEKSYNTGAGLYRLFQFATYVKHNMPFGATFSKPQLSNEEAWDVAAFVNTQPRPQKPFAADWPDLSKKPIDYPLGPYADTFPETQHKYGPFVPMQKNRQ
jgi:thiosulfate dehydrogenase